MTRPPNRRDADCCMTCEQHLQSVLNGLHSCDLQAGGCLMPGQWRVLSQFLGDRRVYIAGRQIDLTQPPHGGNVEYSGCYLEDRDMVEKQVAELNAGGRS